MGRSPFAVILMTNAALVLFGYNLRCILFLDPHPSIKLTARAII